MMTIKVVGSGCPTCEKLAQMCQQVIEEKKLAAQLQKITDIEQFLELGVFMTPGLIINDKLVASGKLPTIETLIRWLEDAAAQEQ